MAQSWNALYYIIQHSTKLFYKISAVFQVEAFYEH